MLRHCIMCWDELHAGENWPDFLIREHKHRCRRCNNKQQRAYQADYREKNREKAKEVSRLWRANNPEKYAEQLARARARRKETK